MQFGVPHSFSLKKSSSSTSHIDSEYPYSYLFKDNKEDINQFQKSITTYSEESPIETEKLLNINNDLYVVTKQIEPLVSRTNNNKQNTIIISIILIKLITFNFLSNSFLPPIISSLNSLFLQRTQTPQTFTVSRLPKNAVVPRVFL